MKRPAGSRNPTYSSHPLQMAASESLIKRLGVWIALLLCLQLPLSADDVLSPSSRPAAPAAPQVVGTVELAAELPLQYATTEQHSAGGTLAAGNSSQGSAQQLDGREVACLAAQSDGSAQVLRSRGRTLIQLYCDQKECSQAAASLVAAALERQAHRQQDIAAANALRAYYTQIAIAEQLDLIVDSQQQLDAAEAKQRYLVEQGIAPGGDLSSFSRRTLELVDQRLQLQSQHRQLSSLLKQLTGQMWAGQVVNVEQLDVRSQDVDCDGLAAFALQHRSDLQAWRLLRRAVNDDTAPELARLLSAVGGGWSIPLPQLGWLQKLFCVNGNACLANNIANELQQVETLLSDSIEQSVAERCEKLQLGYQRTALAQDAVASWQARLEQFDALQEQGEVRPEQRSQAAAGLLEARGVEIQRRLEARLAEVDLAEVIGGLSSRCCRGEAWLRTR